MEAPDEQVQPETLGKPPRSHDRVYGCYVNGENDLIGHIAYSLYKQRKVAFIESILNEEHRSPTAEEIASFRRQAVLDASVTQSRSVAEQVLVEFSTSVLEEEMTDRENEFEIRLKEELKRPKSFWRAVFENVAANLIAIVLTAALLFSMFISEYGLWGTIERLWNDRKAQATSTAPLAPSSVPNQTTR